MTRSTFCITSQVMDNSPLVKHFNFAASSSTYPSSLQILDGRYCKWTYNSDIEINLLKVQQNKYFIFVPFFLKVIRDKVLNLSQNCWLLTKYNATWVSERRKRYFMWITSYTYIKMTKENECLMSRFVQVTIINVRI